MTELKVKVIFKFESKAFRLNKHSAGSRLMDFGIRKDYILKQQ